MARNGPLVAVLALLAVFVAEPAAAQQATVTIRANCSGSSFCYDPAASTVTAGATVVWTNSSGAPHTVTRCTPAACAGTDGGTGSDPSFDSGTVNDGLTFSHPFAAAGTYNYYCAIHGFAVMHGTITVQAAATTTTTAAVTTTTAPATTTTTAAAATTTTTAVASTTTAAVTSSTTVVAATATTVVPATTTTTAAAAASSSPAIARTGWNPRPLIAAAALLALAGVALRKVASRRRSHSV